MGWEHKIAKEFKKRDNPVDTAWFSGEVLSPVPADEDDEGNIIYEGPTIISCFEGQVMLKKDRLKQVPMEDGTPYHLGQTVALLGHPFSKEPGGQKILILGVVEDVI